MDKMLTDKQEQRNFESEKEKTKPTGCRHTSSHKSTQNLLYPYEKFSKKLFHK